MLSLLSYIRYPDIDPVIFQFGPVAVRWYGLAYVLGFALAYLGMHWMIQRGILRISIAQLGSLITWLIPAIILGGRLGWWLFYHRPTGEPEPWYEPIALWHGGMSFHGALIGFSLGLLLWSLIRRAPTMNLADAAALVAPVGLFFGRIANFINAELVGRPSDLPWAVLFPGDTVPRHPSQIYEAILEGPLLLALLWAGWRWLRLKDGQVSALFLIFYGLLRFGVEFTREPDVQIGYIAWGWLTMGQLLSAAIAIIGVAFLLGLQLLMPRRDRDHPPVARHAS